MNTNYIHGYGFKEGMRLQDQASTLTEILHSDTAFGAGSSVLEAGCGVGAQTTILAKNSPGAIITSIDISESSLAVAKEKIAALNLKNVHFRQADLFNLDFAPDLFDHVFVCFVLEHLEQPLAALKALKRVLKPGGTIVAVEGDHGSTFFLP